MIYSNLDSIFASTFASSTKKYVGAVSKDNSTYTLVFEVPRLVRESICVDVDSLNSSYKFFKVTIKAKQRLLFDYLDETQEPTAEDYEEAFSLKGLDIALNGDLTLAYSEGVLSIQIPLQRPVQPKKQGLSARLSDIES